MTIAAPRMNANGEGVMRAYRIDARSNCRSVAATPRGRPGPDDRATAPTPRGCPGDLLARGTPMLASLLISRGHLRPLEIGLHDGRFRIWWDVRVSIGFHCPSFTRSIHYAAWT